MSDLIVSIIRTVVPALVGLIIATLANVGIDVDSDSLVVVLNGLFIGAYYALARLLESRFPAAGWLLGQPKPPTYDGDGS